MVKISISDFINKDKNRINKSEIETIQEIKNRQIKNNKNKFEFYNKIYLNCIENINKSSKSNKYMTIYYPPKNTLDINDYNLSECLNYLFNKLNEIGFKTKLINNYILISWG